MSIYKITSDLPVAAWPEARAIKKAQPAPSSSAKVAYQSWVSEALAKGAPEGQRNDVATRLAGYFRSINQPKDITLEVMLGFAGKCNPPMEADEIRAVLDSVSRYTPSKAKTYQGMKVSNPIVESSISTRRLFQFPEEGIFIKIERLKEGDTELHCWLTISTVAMGEIYGPIVFNLLADRSRTSLAKSLTERHEANWLDILDVVSKSVVASLTQQGASVDTADVVIEAQTQWLAHPVMKAKQATLFYGDGGVGKSTFAIALCVSLVTGRHVIPAVSVSRPVNVMYLDWEGTEHEFASSLRAVELGSGANIKKGTLRYRRMRQALPDELDSLQREVNEWNIEAVVIDSIVGASGADVIEAEATRLHFSALAQLGVASFNLTHITKSGMADKPYGSVFFWNYARSVWEARLDTDITMFSITHRKSNYSKLFDSLSWYVQITNDDSDRRVSVLYRRGNAQDSEKLAPGTKLVEQIEGLLRKGITMTVAQIAEELGAKPNTVTQTLRRNFPRKFVRVPPSMSWGLAVINPAMEHENGAPFAPRDRLSPLSHDMSQPISDRGVLKSTPPRVTSEIGGNETVKEPSVTLDTERINSDTDAPTWEGEDDRKS